MRGSALRHDTRPSPNHEERKRGLKPSILLLHYTGMASAELALKRLCDPSAKVSCHYLIDVDGRIIQMVDEDRRAWHAGVGSWRGATDINSMSIGVEIQNIGHNGDYPDYTAAQMDAVVALGKDIVLRNDIRAERVLGHSDVAPARKADPGEKFDWRMLHESGLGHWVPPVKRNGNHVFGPGDSGSAVGQLQQALAHYGYGIDVTDTFDVATSQVVTAFQRHFRQERVDGLADPSTIETLFRLTAALPLTSDGTA